MEVKKNKILVAVDGSENSRRAVIKSKAYAAFFNGEITLLTVLKPLVLDYYSYPEISYEGMRAASETVLKDALKIFGENQKQINHKIRTGSPADQIIEEATEGKYDLIIMGSRGLGVFSGTILGSVSNKVLNHSPCDILVVK